MAATKMYSIWNTVNNQWAHAPIPDFLEDEDDFPEERRVSTAYNPIFMPLGLAKEWLYHRQSRTNYPERLALKLRPTNWKIIASRMNHALKFL